MNASDKFAASRGSVKKQKSAISSEKLAIVTCGLLIAVFAIPVLVIIQAVAAIFWGTIEVCKLLRGEGLYDDKEGL
jgi:hypothetical protein